MFLFITYRTSSQICSVGKSNLHTFRPFLTTYLPVGLHGFIRLKRLSYPADIQIIISHYHHKLVTRSLEGRTQ